MQQSRFSALFQFLDKLALKKHSQHEYLPKKGHDAIGVFHSFYRKKLMLNSKKEIVTKNPVTLMRFQWVSDEARAC